MNQVERIIYMRNRLNDARAWARDGLYDEAVDALDRGIVAAGLNPEIRAGALFRDLIMLRDGIIKAHKSVICQGSTNEVALNVARTHEFPA